MSFDAVAYAHEELVPRLRALCTLAESDEAPDQQRFFAAVLAGIESAREPDDLADPFLQLSMSAFQGFRFGPATDLLLDELLALAGRLAETLAIGPGERN